MTAMSAVQKRSKLTASEYAYRLLSFRERSEKELKSRMKKAGFDEDNVENALRKVKVSGYVDDERFAKNFAESKRSKGFGKLRLRYALKEKGIEETIVRSVVDSMTDGEEIERARSLIARKMKTMRGTIGKKERESLRLFLLRKGYSYFIVSKALKDFCNNDESYDV